MNFQSLEHTKIEDIVSCFVDSFQDYFVKMPSDVSFWKKRFEAARVDYSLSYGVFNKSKLIGFIIHAIDFDDGKKTAYNTGTGIIPEYRGNQLVDKLYDFAFPFLKTAGIQRCKLEVIDQNQKAIKVYERIGFKITRRLKCFSGEIKKTKKILTDIKEVALSEIKKLYPNNSPYSWDNTLETISRTSNQYKAFVVYTENALDGYFIINPETGYIAQIESKNNHWEILFYSIDQLSSTIKINNVDVSRVHLIEYLKKNEILNTIDQFEMELGF